MRSRYRYGNITISSENVEDYFKEQEKIGIDDLFSFEYRDVNREYMIDNNIPKDSPEGIKIQKKVDAMNSIIETLKQHLIIENQQKEIQRLLERIPEELRDRAIKKIFNKEFSRRYRDQEGLERKIDKSIKEANGVRISSGFVKDEIEINGVNIKGFRLFRLHKDLIDLYLDEKSYFTRGYTNMQAQELKDFCKVIIDNSRITKIPEEEQFKTSEEVKKAQENINTLKEFFGTHIEFDMEKAYDAKTVGDYSRQKINVKKALQRYEFKISELEDLENTIDKTNDAIKYLRESKIPFKSDKAKQKVISRLTKGLAKQMKKMQKTLKEIEDLEKVDGLDSYLNNIELYEEFIVAHKELHKSRYEKLDDLHQDQKAERAEEDATFGRLSEEQIKKFEETVDKVIQIEIAKGQKVADIKRLPEGQNQSKTETQRGKFLKELSQTVDTDYALKENIQKEDQKSVEDKEFEEK